MEEKPAPAEKPAEEKPEEEEEAGKLLEPRPSVRQTLTELVQLAGKGKAPPSQLQISGGVEGRHPKNAPLVPVFVGTEREGSIFREQFLWRLNDPAANTSVTAERLTRELNLPQGLERIVEDSINAGIKPFKSPVIQIPGDPHSDGVASELMVALDIKAKAEGLIFKDRVEWDLMDPMNMPEQYALGVCEDLDLGMSMFEAIVKSVQEQMQSKLKHYADCRRRGITFPSLQPPAKRIRTDEESESWRPVVRLEEDGDDDDDDGEEEGANEEEKEEEAKEEAGEKGGEAEQAAVKREDREVEKGEEKRVVTETCAEEDSAKESGGEKEAPAAKQEAAALGASQDPAEAAKKADGGTSAHGREEEAQAGDNEGGNEEDKDQDADMDLENELEQAMLNEGDDEGGDMEVDVDDLAGELEAELEKKPDATGGGSAEGGAA